FAGQRTGIVESLLESPPGFAGHLTCGRGDRRDEAEVVERRRADRAQDLARLADRAPQELGRFADLRVLDAGALQLRVRGDEDRGEPVVQIARKATPMFFVLRQKLTGEVLKVAVELHPLDGEGRLIADDS